MNLSGTTKCPLVSIVVPTYNVGQYICRSLKSLQQQDYENIEVIVVDDCSSDNTMSVAQTFAADDTRFHVVQQKENAGAGAARWRGIQLSHGAFIGFLDADDWADSHFVSELVRAQTETGCDIVCCQHFFYWSDKHITTPWPYDNRRLVIDNQNAVQRMCTYDRIGTELWNKLFRCSLVKAYPMHSMEFEDAFYLIDVMKAAKSICVYSIPLVYYTQREGSLMNSRYSIEKEISHCRLSVCQARLYNDVGLKANPHVIKKCIRTFKNMLLVSEPLTVAGNKEEILSLLRSTADIHYARHVKLKYRLKRWLILHLTDFYARCYTGFMRRFCKGKIQRLRASYKRTSADVCSGK